MELGERGRRGGSEPDITMPDLETSFCWEACVSCQACSLLPRLWTLPGASFSLADRSQVSSPPSESAGGEVRLRERDRLPRSHSPPGQSWRDSDSLLAYPGLLSSEFKDAERDQPGVKIHSKRGNGSLSRPRPGLTPLPRAGPHLGAGNRFPVSHSAQ